MHNRLKTLDPAHGFNNAAMTVGRTPLERLKALMRTSRTTPPQLRSIMGSSQSMVSMILNGHRALSKMTITILADHFRIDPGYFM